jgi:threonyl-tRNA synthetase
VLPISDHQADAARGVHARFRAAGLRAVLDESNETLSYRIRHAELLKVPYVAVVGQREADSGTIAVRVRGAGNKQDVVPVDEFVARVQAEVATRALVP